MAMRIQVSTMAVFGLFIAAPALAQSSAVDQRYCAALVDLYVRYVGSSEFSSDTPGRFRTDPEARLAIYRCEQGDAAFAIPVLEQRLRNARVSLPPRG